MPEVRPESGPMMPRAIKNAISRPSSAAAPATISCMVTVLVMRPFGLGGRLLEMLPDRILEAVHFFDRARRSAE